MARRTAPRKGITTDTYVLEILGGELVYGMLALPPQLEEGPFAEGVTLDMSCLVRQPAARAGEPVLSRLLGERSMGAVLTYPEPVETTPGVGELFLDEGRWNFGLRAPADMLDLVSDRVRSGEFKFIEIQATPFRDGISVVLSFDFSRTERTAADRAAMLAKAQGLREALGRH